MLEIWNHSYISCTHKMTTSTSVFGDWRISTHADPTSTRRAIANVFKFHERRISSVTFISAHFYSNVHMRVGVARALAVSSDFGLQGRKVHKNLWFPALDADVTLLALSSAKKSVTVKTNKQQTIYPHLAYRHVWITRSSAIAEVPREAHRRLKSSSQMLHSCMKTKSSATAVGQRDALC